MRNTQNALARRRWAYQSWVSVAMSAARGDERPPREWVHASAGLKAAEPEGGEDRGAGLQAATGGREAPERAGAGGERQALVEVRDVHKRFGDTQALAGCSLTAFAGEVHALVGENGSGKSTLAKVLAGVIRPDSGSAMIEGQRPGSPRAALRLGVGPVFQEVLVADGATVLDNLYLGHDSFMRATSAMAVKRARASELLPRLLDAPVDLDAPIESLTLSGRQWVVIARALVGAPRLLILDEAAAALDQASAGRLLDEVRRAREAGVCVLMVTHRIAEVTAVADRVTVLRDGRDVGTVTGEEIRETRLLELMSDQARRQHARPPSPGAAADVGECALKVADARLTSRSSAIDVELHHGEIVGVSGLEGHGQADFMRALAGIEPLVAGTVRAPRARGGEIQLRSIGDATRAGVVYISGDRKREGIFPNLSVIENFGLPLMRRASRFGIVDRLGLRRRYRHHQEALAIKAARPSLPIVALSGGNQQKVLIARALAQAPSVVLLNDPTRGVDLATKREFYELLRRLASGGTSVVFMSSEIEEFLGLCNRVLVFRNGHVCRMLSGSRISEAEILAAMFGRQAAESDGELQVKR